uniref:Uncharacterized protein n=1 Tax=Timema tahoe TaxID=61484 RepID=A0A7R9IIJ9_9NEOP|nr:unnamed protein product [Timema tahoe]
MYHIEELSRFVEGKHNGLIFIRLPFSEDLRDFLFGSLKSDLEGITDDQIKSIDTLIDRMDLMVIGHNGEELFESKNLIDPHYQHMLASLSHRSLYPDSQLPPPKSTILELITSPFDVEESHLATSIEESSQENIQLTLFHRPCVLDYKSERRTTQPSLITPRDRLAAAFKFQTAPTRVHHITKDGSKSLNCEERLFYYRVPVI